MGRVKYEENLGDDIMRVSANPIPYSKINVTAKSGLCWLQTFYASNLYIIKLLLLFVLCFNTKRILVLKVVFFSTYISMSNHRDLERLTGGKCKSINFLKDETFSKKILSDIL